MLSTLAFSSVNYMLQLMFNFFTQNKWDAHRTKRWVCCNLNRKCVYLQAFRMIFYHNFQLISLLSKRRLPSIFILTHLAPKIAFIFRTSLNVSISLNEATFALKIQLGFPFWLFVLLGWWTYMATIVCLSSKEIRICYAAWGCRPQSTIF